MSDHLATVVHLGACVAAIGALVSSLELIVRPAQLADSGLISWRVSKLQGRWASLPGLGAILDHMFAYPNVLALHAVRSGAAITLLCLPRHQPLCAVFAGIVVAATILQHVRSPFGLDGADHMTVQVLVPACLFYACPTEFVGRCVIWFIGAQVSLSYLTAGVSKLQSSDWRGPDAMRGILGTRIYGSPIVGHALRASPTLAMTLSRTVILGELVLAIAIFLPFPATIAVCALGLAFHLASAIFMGLNSFVWAFAATYPAVLMCSMYLDTFL